MKAITNSSGTFWLDAEGVLRKFECAEKNYYHPLLEPHYRNEKHLFWLHIPEGVRVIPEEAFRWCHVQQRLTFP